MKLAIKVGLVLVALIGAWMFWFHARGWQAQQRLETQPQVLEQTKKAKKAKRRRLTREQAAELCSGLAPIAVQKSAPKGVLKSEPRPVGLEQFDGFELDSRGGFLLDEVAVPKLPYGGTAEVTLAVGAAVPSVVVTPNPRPYVEAMSRFRFSALVGAPLDGGEGSVLVSPRVDWRALRTGRFDYGGGLAYCPARSVIGGVVLGFE